MIALYSSSLVFLYFPLDECLVGTTYCKHELIVLAEGKARNVFAVGGVAAGSLDLRIWELKNIH